MSSTFLGTGELVRLALRRDRLLLPVTVLGFAGMAGLSSAATIGLYPDPAQRFEAAAAVNSTAALVALYGRIYDPTSEGALAMFKLTAFGAAMIAVLMVIVVVRHTRQEEAAGRLELLGSASVGRTAPLAAALIVAFGGSVLVGLATGLALSATGLPVAGSFAFGLGWATAGLSFAAVGAVCAQLTVSSRAAVGLGLITIAISYSLRAIGDLATGTSGWASWLSPIGWTQQLRAYAGERWWVPLLPLLLTVVLVPLAIRLRERRDLAAGVLQERPGAAHGRIRSVFGLAWRLQRGVLLAWVVPFALFSFLLGSIADSISGFLDSEQMAAVIAALGGQQALVQAFLAAELGILGIIATGYGISAAQRLREEEVDGHVELLLAAAVPRWRFAASHLLTACGGVALLLFVAGVGAGLGFTLAVPDATVTVLDIVVAALARIPAAMILTVVAMLLFGWAPRLVGLAWLLYAVAIVLGELGVLWGVPQWVQDLSPFVHSPVLPSQTAGGGAVLPMLAVAAVVASVGFAGWRRRDTPA